MRVALKKTLSFSLLGFLIFSTACREPLKKEASEEHPKLIKTIGDPRYGNVRCSLRDREGNLWFGTTENGLYKYDGKSFNRYLKADGLNSNNIYNLFEDKSGKIWVGTVQGLCCYNPQSANDTGAKTFLEINIPLPKNFSPNKNSLYSKSHWVFSIIQTRNGNIWFATIDGIFIYDGETFKPFKLDAKDGGFMSSNSNVECMLQDKAGNIWFGGRGFNGIYCYDGKSKKYFKLPELFQNGPKPKSTQWAWPQMQDKDGNIWFSNWGGAYCYNGKSFTGYSKQDGLPGIVTCIVQDKKGIIWFGGDGLSRLDKPDKDSIGSGKSFITYTTKDGLINMSVWTILVDKEEKLWIGTRETSLYRFDGKTFVPYSEYKQ